MNIFEKLSKIYGREITKNDHIVLDEINMYKEMTGKEISAESAAEAVLRSHEKYVNEMDLMSDDYQNQAPCDNAGRMKLISSIS